MNATTLFARPYSRVIDVVDVELANAMLTSAGRAPLTMVAVGGGMVEVSADADQIAVLRYVTWTTEPAAMERWVLTYAPALTAAVTELVGPHWLAEVELSVDLTLALRSDDMDDLAERLSEGPVTADCTRTAAQTMADLVPDPALVHFL